MHSPASASVPERITNFLKAAPSKILRRDNVAIDQADGVSNSLPTRAPESTYMPAHAPHSASLDLRNVDESAVNPLAALLPATTPHAADATVGAAASSSTLVQKLIPEHRVKRFLKLLEEPVVDLDALRDASWNGVPHMLRPQVWRLLLGYVPPAKSRQAQTLARRRREYVDLIPEYYDVPPTDRSEDELAALRQVMVDTPRTAPSVPFFHEPTIQQSLERVLYIWGIRHPASGYVQGMNDITTPFLAVFLSEHLHGPMDLWDAALLSEEAMLEVEADVYWCLCKLVEQIQDHYTYAQPGIQRIIFRARELVYTQHKDLTQCLERHGVDFIQFAFRWVNCLLVRELPFVLSIRLWDTYLAEGTNFSDFLAYMCAAFLIHWKHDLLKPDMDFQDLVLFLQKVPTGGWDGATLEGVLSQAYSMKQRYHETRGHLPAMH